MILQKYWFCTQNHFGGLWRTGKCIKSWQLWLWHVFCYVILLFILFTWTNYTMSPRCEWHTCVYVFYYIFHLHHTVRDRFIMWRNYQSAAFEYRNSIKIKIRISGYQIIQNAQPYLTHNQHTCMAYFFSHFPLSKHQPPTLLNGQ